MQIISIEKKTTREGKAKADATVFTGEKQVEVTIWGDFPGYETLVPGVDVSATIVPSRDLKYRPSLKAITEHPKSYTPKKVDFAAAQERKAQYIEKAQDRKEESIAFFNATNAAIAMVNGPMGDKLLSREEVEHDIVKWRTWFLQQWINWDNTPH